MADAVSPKEAELRREFEAWRDNTWRTVKDSEWLAYKAGAEAGERKERERCAKVAEAGAVVHTGPHLGIDGLGSGQGNQRRIHVGCVQSGYGGGGYSCHLAIARVIRGGESQ